MYPLDYPLPVLKPILYLSSSLSNLSSIAYPLPVLYLSYILSSLPVQDLFEPHSPVGREELLRGELPLRYLQQCQGEVEKGKNKVFVQFN